MNEREVAAIVRGVVPSLRQHIESEVTRIFQQATSDIISRIAELEKRQPEKGEPGEKGEQGEPGPRGDRGSDAYPGRARGLFDADAEYLARDVVALNGSAFMAKHDGPGECPGEGWMLLAQRGKRGDKGVSFSGGILDKDTFELCLQREDGEEVVIDLSALRKVYQVGESDG